jgi:streptogramin lyase
MGPRLAAGMAMLFGLAGCHSGSAPAAAGVSRFTAASKRVFSGSMDLLTADFSGGTAGVDQGVGAMTANQGKWTGPLTADTTFTLVETLTAGGSVSAQAQVKVFQSLLTAAGTSSALYHPTGIVMGAQGSLYVADTADDTIDLLTPATAGGVTAWNVTVIAGTTGIAGYADGPGAGATFNAPGGIALDAAGNLYVADSGNSTIRMLAPATAGGVTTWTVSTIAGDPAASGSGDGALGASSFNQPYGVAVDASGKVYVADTGNNTLRLLTPGTTGGVTTWSTATIAGTAGGSTFNQPSGVAVDGSGQVYVADPGNQAIRLVTPGNSGGTPTWSLSTIAGTPGAMGNTDGGPGIATFYEPVGIVVGASGNVCVADPYSGTIRLLKPSVFPVSAATTWAVSTIAGSAPVTNPPATGNRNGSGPAARFNSPYGVAMDGSGSVYVADTGNDGIRLLSPPAAGATTWTVSAITGSGTANGPGATATFNQPYGVAVDGSGNVYVADTNNQIIRLFRPAAASGAPAWTVSTIAGIALTTGAADGALDSSTFYNPYGVAVDRSGNVYVVDSWNDTIRQLTPSTPGVVNDATTWTVSTIAGIARTTGSADGGLGESTFHLPVGLAQDPAGNLYVADTTNSTIRMLTPTTAQGKTSWNVSTIAGSPGSTGSADGPGAAATFWYPCGVATDASGQVYVADSWNNTIRLLIPPHSGTASWTVATIAGSPAPAVPGTASGPGASATFNFPYGMAVDGSGNVYVADQSGNSLRMLTPLTAGDGKVAWTVGTVLATGDALAGQTTFTAPGGLALDPVTGGLFFAVPNAVLEVW